MARGTRKKRETIKAIPTDYNGVHFRSRLEARWAVFFDNLRMTWTYEPPLPFEPLWPSYRPDFYVSVKGITCQECTHMHRNYPETDPGSAEFCSKSEDDAMASYMGPCQCVPRLKMYLEVKPMAPGEDRLALLSDLSDKNYEHYMATAPEDDEEGAPFVIVAWGPPNAWEGVLLGPACYGAPGRIWPVDREAVNMQQMRSLWMPHSLEAAAFAAAFRFW